jgi:hypothetical protein
LVCLKNMSKKEITGNQCLNKSDANSNNIFLTTGHYFLTKNIINYKSYINFGQPTLTKFHS